MSTTRTVLFEHWETLHALLRQHGPLELIAAGYELQERMTAAAGAAVQQEIDSAAGEALRIGRDLGQQEGWQERDHQAVRELSEKDGHIAALTAMLTVERERVEELRSQMGVSTSHDVAPVTPADTKLVH